MLAHKVPTSEQLGQFFEQIVGSNEAITSLQGNLSDQIGGTDSPAEAYERLENSARLVIRQTVAACREQNEPVSRAEATGWRRIYGNANFGLATTIAGLQAVGDIYGDNAAVPQQKAVVQRSMHRAIGHIFGIAFSGAFVGALNLEGMKHGLNARNPLNIPYLLTCFVADSEPASNYYKGFTSTINPETGQVDVQPKHRRMERILPAQCPATLDRTEIGRSKKSSLYLFMGAIGNVAVSDIYPLQFDIVP